jgi:hypothetical protein
MMIEGVATEVYIQRAGNLIKALGLRANPNECAPEWYKPCKAQFDAILSAMLQFSVECGRYVDSHGECSR